MRFTYMRSLKRNNDTNKKKIVHKQNEGYKNVNRERKRENVREKVSESEYSNEKYEP